VSPVKRFCLPACDQVHLSHPDPWCAAPRSIEVYNKTPTTTHTSPPLGSGHLSERGEASRGKKSNLRYKATTGNSRMSPKGGLIRFERHHCGGCMDTHQPKIIMFKDGLSAQVLRLRGLDLFPRSLKILWGGFPQRICM
jgi:hypothetical protein